MAWLHFLADYDFTPRRQRGVTIEYKAGMRCPVVRECLKQAVKLGVATEIETPSRADAAKLAADPFWTVGSERRQRLVEAARAARAEAIEAATTPPPADRPVVDVAVDLPTVRGPDSGPSVSA